MKPAISILVIWSFALAVTGCSIAMNETELNAYFDRQKGSWLTERQTSGCNAVVIGGSLVEFIPQETPTDGWAVVWTVDTSRISELNASSSEKLAGKIVSWRIIGDRSKVRIPARYSAG